ncbi:MAG: FecR family protein [Planctomycetota bacterium]|nr:FecR family protein [Planctomycetota bacterium]
MRHRARHATSATIVALFATTAVAQDHGPKAGSLPPIDQVEVAQLHMAALAAATATGPVEVIAAGSTKILEAVILEVRGRCQWRTDEEARWQKAAIDHRLKPGAMIRTGLKSHLALRCGPNATILVDSNSRVMVPALAQNGDTLSTIVQVERGRADFKVDRVGLTNDFSVVTPSGALSVRGTGMGVSYDGFQGSSIYGARFNSINAIEMRYYGNKRVWSVSGGGSTSSRAKNPTTKAVAKAVGGRKPLNKSNAMDAKGSTSKGGPPQSGVGGGLRETTRLVLGAEQGLRASQRREEFEQVGREAIAAEQLALLAEQPVEPPPYEPPNEPPPPPPPDEPPPPPPPADDPPAPPDDPPPVDVIDLDGFQSYFREVVSPTDRGMVAAAIMYDLMPYGSGEFLPGVPNAASDDGQDIWSDGIIYRQQIPTLFEPNIYDPAGGTNNPLGVRNNLPKGDNLQFPNNNAINYPENFHETVVGGMYQSIYEYGFQRHLSEWQNGDSSHGPMDHDLDVILQHVDQFAGHPAFMGKALEVRGAFSTAVEQAIYPNSSGFGPYGQSLLYQHMQTDLWPPQP